jgi:uncharacterized protein YjbI with pentapeptide repeats
MRNPEPSTQRAETFQALERHEKWRKDQSAGQRAEFTQADLRGFDFSGRDLTGAWFTACDLRGANLRGCNLSFTAFTCCDLRAADLRSAQAARVIFHGADFRDADLRGLHGFGSDFSAADFRGAKMEGAHLKKTALNGALVNATDLKGVRLEQVFAPDGSLISSATGSQFTSTLATTLQRMLPRLHAINSHEVLAYEQGSGPALWDRLRAADKRSVERGELSSQAPDAHQTDQEQDQESDQDHEPEISR